jgi:hypothetical protein
VGGFDVEITSDLVLSAAFTGSVTFNNLLSTVTGGAITIPESLLLVEFTAFGINMDINSKYYEFYANANIDLNFITNVSVTDGTLRLTSLLLQAEQVQAFLQHRYQGYLPLASYNLIRM